ncbi:MAG: hypothetical protein MUC48_18255 [Leptolyngbya sp. Prado105]|nr:hypothetical protein [Leptolyngbya sp. Prado105]
MRYVLILGMVLCLFLSGCEFVTPDTSNALSQTRQQEELAKQTEQIKRQTDAIERLTDSVEKLVNSQTQP